MILCQNLLGYGVSILFCFDVANFPTRNTERFHYTFIVLAFDVFFSGGEGGLDSIYVMATLVKGIFVYIFMVSGSEAIFMEESGTRNPNPGPVWPDVALGDRI